MQQFLAELKRRRVFRVAAAYAVVAFVVAQVADIFLPGLGLPEWSLRLVLALLILGFPVALVLAWAFDITPEGVVRTEPRAEDARSAAAEMPVPMSVGRIAVVGALLILGLAGGAFVVLRDRGPELAPQRVVIAPFENRTGDPSLDPLGDMAADWITRGLSQLGLVEVVDASAARAVAAGAGELAGAARVRTLAEGTGAGLVVTGAYYRQGDSLQFQAQLVDARQGKLLRAVEPASGALAEPLAAAEVLRQRVMGVLAAKLDPRLSNMAAEASQPPTYEAYQAWLAGLELFARLEFRESIPHLLRAASLDSTFASARIWAAAAHGNMGEYAPRDSILRVVNRSRERLLPLDRHLLDYHLAHMREDRVGNHRAARKMAEVAPGSGLAAYLLGNAALRVNRPQEAANALQGFAPERMMREWYIFGNPITDAYHVLGQHRQELSEARRALDHYPELLRAISDEVRALAALGRVGEVRERVERSLALPPQTGGWTPWRVMHNAALELRAHGHPEVSREVLERALAWLNARPLEEQQTEVHRYRLAQTLYLAGRWQEAEALLRSLVDEHPTNLDYQGYLGTLAARRGDRTTAEEISAALARLDRPYLSGRHTYWRARVAALLNQREQAVALLREAFAQGAIYGVHPHTDADLEPLRDYPPFRELMKPKG